jgi:hypothetical protein
MIKLMTSIGMATAAGKEISSIIHERWSPYQPLKPLFTLVNDSTGEIQRKLGDSRPRGRIEQPTSNFSAPNHPPTNNPCIKRINKYSRRWEYLHSRFTYQWNACNYQQPITWELLHDNELRSKSIELIEHSNLVRTKTNKSTIDWEGINDEELRSKSKELLAICPLLNKEITNTTGQFLLNNATNTTDTTTNNANNSPHNEINSLAKERNRKRVDLLIETKIISLAEEPLHFSTVDSNVPTTTPSKLSPIAQPYSPSILSHLAAPFQPLSTPNIPLPSQWFPNPTNNTPISSSNHHPHESDETNNQHHYYRTDIEEE